MRRVELSTREREEINEAAPNWSQAWSATHASLASLSRFKPGRGVYNVGAGPARTSSRVSSSSPSRASTRRCHAPSSELGTRTVAPGRAPPTRGAGRYVGGADVDEMSRGGRAGRSRPIGRAYEPGGRGGLLAAWMLLPLAEVASARGPTPRVRSIVLSRSAIRLNALPDWLMPTARHSRRAATDVVDGRCQRPPTPPLLPPLSRLAALLGRTSLRRRCSSVRAMSEVWNSRRCSVLSARRGGVRGCTSKPSAP